MTPIFDKESHAPRWIILIIDLLITSSSIVIAYYLRFNFDLPDIYFNVDSYESFYWIIPLVLTIRLLSFLVSKLYTGIIRYTGTKDAGRIFNVIWF